MLLSRCVTAGVDGSEGAASERSADRVVGSGREVATSGEVMMIPALLAAAAECDTCCGMLQLQLSCWQNALLTTANAVIKVVPTATTTTRAASWAADNTTGDNEVFARKKEQLRCFGIVAFFLSFCCSTAVWQGLARFGTVWLGRILRIKNPWPVKMIQGRSGKKHGCLGEHGSTRASAVAGACDRFACQNDVHTAAPVSSGRPTHFL